MTDRMIRTLAALLMAALLGLSGVAMAQTDDPTDPTDDPSPDDSGSPDDSESPDDEPSEDDAVVGDRVSGSDRISTAVAISQYEFPDGADEAYLARADNFADAVAAGALRRGPVLLVPSCGDLPAVVAAELARLSPSRVVALGGPAAICDDILTQGVTAAGGPSDDPSDGPSDDPSDDPSDGPSDNPSDDPSEGELVDMVVGEERTFDADVAGQVTIRRTETGVELVAATPADESWTVDDDPDAPGEVHVEFTDGATEVDFQAELEDGRVRIRVRTQDA